MKKKLYLIKRLSKVINILIKKKKTTINEKNHISTIFYNFN